MRRANGSARVGFFLFAESRGQSEGAPRTDSKPAKMCKKISFQSRERQDNATRENERMRARALSRFRAFALSRFRVPSDSASNSLFENF
jgi:hypothetical protein